MWKHNRHLSLKLVISVEKCSKPRIVWQVIYQDATDNKKELVHDREIFFRIINWKNLPYHRYLE